MSWNMRRIAEGLGFLTLVSFSCLPSAATAVPIYYFTTGQAGTQAQLDASHTVSYNFTATSAWMLGGGDFTMKAGSSATANVMLALYRGNDATGTLIDKLTLTGTTFCTLHTGNCGTFNSTPLHFAAPDTLTSGLNYYLALTSDASNVQSQAYFIKDPGTVTIQDSTGTPLPNQTVGTSASATPISIPEPPSLAIVATLLAGLRVRLGRKGMAGTAKPSRRAWFPPMSGYSSL